MMFGQSSVTQLACAGTTQLTLYVKAGPMSLQIITQRHRSRPVTSKDALQCSTLETGASQSSNWGRIGMPAAVPRVCLKQDASALSVKPLEGNGAICRSSVFPDGGQLHVRDTIVVVVPRDALQKPGTPPSARHGKARGSSRPWPGLAAPQNVLKKWSSGTEIPRLLIPLPVQA